VYCTRGTADLAGILLPDSGHLQQEDAEYLRRKRLDEESEPLYDEAQARAALKLLEPCEFAKPVAVLEGVRATFHRAGHILGAASVHLDIGGSTLMFSGDLGRPDDLVMRAPEPFPGADFLVMESTYGDRRHPDASALDTLREVVVRTVRRRGVLMIPAFAVGRAQTLLHLLARLRDAGDIPDVPMFLNSPMSIDATGIYCDHADEHRLSDAACREMCTAARFVNSADESRALNRRSGPMIVISASGMATGGRILHHFKAWLEDPRNTVLFAGYQAPGTRGAELLSGAREVRVHGRRLAVKAEVAEISSLSAHADADELVTWLTATAAPPPRTVFVTHGDPQAAEALRARIDAWSGWTALTPAHDDRHALA
jgi:metallo-beta-lactamase family protein